MASIAVSIIGHNNAAELATALDSTRWADQVIYVDCESTDGSMDIARRYTDRTYRRPNTTQLNINKCFGFEQVTADWIFYLDPDEIIPPKLAEEIRAVTDADPAHNAYGMPRKNIYFGRWLKHGGKYPDVQVRLFRRGKASFACRHVHERLDVEGSIGRLRSPMLHHPCESPTTAIRKMDFYSTYNAESMAREGMRPTPRLALQFLVGKPLSRFFRRYVLRAGFLDGWPGLIVVSIDSIDFLFRYFKFWYLAAHPEALPAQPQPGDSAETELGAAS